MRTLTDREFEAHNRPQRAIPQDRQEILELVAMGKSVPEIAAITGRTESAVKYRLERLSEALDAYRLTLLVARGYQRGILKIEQEAA